jgi:hypothetical protein
MSNASQPVLLRDCRTTMADLCRPFAMIAGACIRWQRHRHTRRITSALTDAQLMDTGIDPAILRRNRPSMEIKAGLMANLMSMR